MRSIAQKTVIDRLAASLEANGVKLKRAKVMEIAAQALGHADSNHLAAAAKAGEIDPPVAPHESKAFCRLGAFAILRDPSTGRLFGVDEASLDRDAPPWVVSPYGGGLLALPELDRNFGTEYPSPGRYTVRNVDGSPLDPSLFKSRIVPEGEKVEVGTITIGPQGGAVFRKSSALGLGTSDSETFLSEVDGHRLVAVGGVDDDGRCYQQVGHGLRIVEPHGSSERRLEEFATHEVERFAPLIGRDLPGQGLASEKAPVLVGASTVDGRPNLLFRENAPGDHEGRRTAIERVRACAVAMSGDLRRVGAMMRWTDDSFAGRVVVDIHVPMEQTDHLSGSLQLEDALLGLMRSPAGRDAHRLRALTPGMTDVRDISEGEISISPDYSFFERRLKLDGLREVDGVVHHVVRHEAHYDPEDASRRDVQLGIVTDMRDHVRPLAERLGGACRLINGPGLFVVETLLPISASRDVPDKRSWCAAIASLYGSGERVFVRYVPQERKDGSLVAVEPEGDPLVDVTWEVLASPEREIDVRPQGSSFVGRLAPLMAPEWIRARKGPFSVVPAREPAHVPPRWTEEQVEAAATQFGRSASAAIGGRLYSDRPDQG